MANTNTQSGYLNIGDLKMYYEIHGKGEPLILLHGAFSAIGSSFDALLPELAKTRQVIGLELQAHGRTADIDRPMTLENHADDVAAAIQALGLEYADIFGYSMGAAVALRVVLRHPQVVRKLVFMSAGYALNGIHPGLMEGFGEMKPEMLHGSPWHDEYMRIAPHPEHFARLFEKKTAMDKATTDIPAEELRTIRTPTLVIIGDSDLIRPEHAVEMFRLLGGGVFGDMPPGMPNSQLAIVPGASHVSVATRAELLIPILNAFLDAPMPTQN